MFELRIFPATTTSRRSMRWNAETVAIGMERTDQTSFNGSALSAKAALLVCLPLGSRRDGFASLALVTAAHLLTNGPPAPAAYAAFDPTGHTPGWSWEAKVIERRRQALETKVTGRFGGPKRYETSR